MKKNLLFLFALICSMSLFTACNDDDESLPIDEELAGTYKGGLDIAVNGAPLAKDVPQKIYISKAGSNQIKLELKEFSFMGIALGTIEISNSELVKKGDEYTFTGSQNLKLDVVGDCSASVAGTMNGKTIDVNIDVNVPALGQTVKVNFTGNKLAGTESTEAKITAFTFDRNVAAVDSLVLGTTIDEVNKTISIAVADTAKAQYLKMLVPTIKISDKAVVTPGSEVVQDFNSPIKYTVIAEDGTVVEYIATVIGTKYDFETWSDKGNMYSDIFNPIGWATCNDAVGLIKNMGDGYEGEYPVRFTEDRVSGEKALLLESVDTKGGIVFGQKVPKVTAGTAFLGSFNAIAALVDPMATTSFGIMYDRKPIEVTGYFKYTAGTDFYDENGIKVEQKDECALSAVLYEVQDETETLNGTTIFESDKIIASAMMNSLGQPAYAPFTLKLAYIKDYDKSKKYKLAVIFSASKEGAAYRAAIGSKLYVDDVAIISE